MAYILLWFRDRLTGWLSGPASHAITTPWPALAGNSVPTIPGQHRDTYRKLGHRVSVQYYIRLYYIFSTYTI